MFDTDTSAPTHARPPGRPPPHSHIHIEPVAIFASAHKPIIKLLIEAIQIIILRSKYEIETVSRNAKYKAHIQMARRRMSIWRVRESSDTALLGVRASKLIYMETTYAVDDANIQYQMA